MKQEILFSFSFPSVATVDTLEKIPLNFDNLCLAYPRLFTVATQVVVKKFSMPLIWFLLLASCKVASVAQLKFIL
jgi:hypothetical protein